MKQGQIKHQIKYFNKEYKTYQKYRLENWRISYMKRVFEKFNLKKGQKYLDIGCGGNAYLPIEAAKRKVKAYGVDISTEAIKKAQMFAKNESVSELTNFKKANAENLPFKDNQFHAVSAIALLEHLENDKKAVEEMGRVCKKGGLVFITVPNAYKSMPLYTWIPYLIHDKQIGHLRHYSAKHLTHLFESAGFKTQGVFYSGHNIKFLQLLLYKLTKNDHLWWKLEKKDIAQKSKWAVTLSALFEKP